MKKSFWVIITLTALCFFASCEKTNFGPSLKNAGTNKAAPTKVCPNRHPVDFEGLAGTGGNLPSGELNRIFNQCIIRDRACVYDLDEEFLGTSTFEITPPSFIENVSDYDLNGNGDFEIDEQDAIIEKIIERAETVLQNYPTPEECNYFLSGIRIFRDDTNDQLVCFFTYSCCLRAKEVKGF